MSQTPPRHDPDEDAVTRISAGDPAADDGGTPTPASEASPGAGESSWETDSDTSAGLACSACGQPLSRESRFCQSCGQRVGDQPPARQAATRARRQRGVLIGLTVLWLVIMVAAFYFIYGLAFVIGSP